MGIFVGGDPIEGINVSEVYQGSTKLWPTTKAYKGFVFRNITVSSSWYTSAADIRFYDENFSEFSYASGVNGTATANATDFFYDPQYAFDHVVSSTNRWVKTGNTPASDWLKFIQNGGNRILRRVSITPYDINYAFRTWDMYGINDDDSEDLIYQQTVDPNYSGQGDTKTWDLF
jgi:hypothetical protein